MEGDFISFDRYCQEILTLEIEQGRMKLQKIFGKVEIKGKRNSVLGLLSLGSPKTSSSEVSAHDIRKIMAGYESDGILMPDS